MQEYGSFSDDCRRQVALRRRFLRLDPGTGGIAAPRAGRCIQLQRTLTRSIAAKLDLPDRYRFALRLLCGFARDLPDLMSRVPAECPYSLDQILGSAEEDWFPAPR
jgi:hypothetical protein